MGVMAQLIVRDVDDQVVAALEARAARSRRSAEAEHRQLLREALFSDRRSVDDFMAAAARLRARIGQLPADAPRSENVIRKMRDER